MRDAVFVWIPRTAGTSIYTVLWSSVNAKKLKEPSRYKNFSNTGVVTFGHVSINFLLRKKYLSQSFLDSAFTFCFVRNPWDRLVSLYHYFRKGGSRSRYKMANGSFAKFCCRLRDSWENLPKIGSYNVRGASQCNCQLDWITDSEGKLMVDFVGHYERLRKDFKKVSKILAIRKSLGHQRSTDHKHYRRYYSDKTRRIVARLYKKEIKMFGYYF